MSKHSVVGVDFGKGVLRAVEVLDPSGSRPTITRHHEVPLPLGAVVGGEVRSIDQVTAALKALWSEAGFKTKKVVLGMGNQRVLVRELAMPKMPLERIREALPFQVQELLPVPVADALLDFYPISEGESDGAEVIHGLLVAAVRGAVENNVEAALQAGLEPVGVDLIPFALTRLLLPVGDEGHTVLVHIGASTTSVVFVSDGVPQFVRIIPAGGDDVTRALVTRFELDLPAADRLKRDLGLGKRVAAKDKKAVEVMFEVTGELLTSLRNTFAFYLNTRSVAALDRIVLSGGGARLEGLAAALGEVSRLRVDVIDPGAGFAVAEGAELAEETRDDFAVALGLTLGSAA
ncbi:MAG: pilus assembly protein PilM [Naasia sp.]|jgi:type IV pilus assembly protein PilM|uniref:type IV pilus assembly protein PilM n=1 Tax=Naasia sp. TaxID=2546198 RepID=UPI00260BBEC0|nr:type IV pilus assembly protein PilM [Naasia sp.]MCU1570086.1 pilus assembly protein PilM [Naasia sp.]